MGPEGFTVSRLCETRNLRVQEDSLTNLGGSNLDACPTEPTRACYKTLVGTVDFLSHGSRWSFDLTENDRHKQKLITNANFEMCIEMSR